MVGTLRLPFTVLIHIIPQFCNCGFSVGTLRLPFTVLIPVDFPLFQWTSSCWNAPITVYGIDTEESERDKIVEFECWNAPITVYGIDTGQGQLLKTQQYSWNAPITVYGIDTYGLASGFTTGFPVGTLRLPFTVLIPTYR